MTDDLRKYLRNLARQIGVDFYLVGGAIRDELLGIESDDIDLVSRGLSQDDLMEALSKYGRVEKTGAVFGVIRFFSERKGIPMLEISLPRKELSTGFGHTDFTVEFDHTLPIEEDLLRRDFTINSFAVDVKTGEFFDPSNGLADLRDGYIRVLHEDSAKDDPLRILRGIRFMAKLGFNPYHTTDSLFQEALPLVQHVSAERLQHELLKMIVEPHIAFALRYAQRIGVIRELFPELEATVGCTQNKYHRYDVWEHTIRAVELCPSDDPYVKLAMLFHDIDKPTVKWIDENGEAHFYAPSKSQLEIAKKVPTIVGAHEVVGSDTARKIMKRLKFSTHHTDRVALLVLEHMFARGNRRTARRLLSRLDGKAGGIRENVDGLFAIREADTFAGKPLAGEEFNEKNRAFHKIVLEELESKTAFTVRDLALNGHDLMKLGFKGPDIGRVQKLLLEAVIEDPELNKAEVLETVAKSLTGAG